MNYYYKYFLDIRIKLTSYCIIYKEYIYKSFFINIFKLILKKNELYKTIFKENIVIYNYDA
jgi:hypothetical protein